MYIPLGWVCCVPWLYCRVCTVHTMYVFLCIVSVRRAYRYSILFESRGRPTPIHTKPGLSSTVPNFAGWKHLVSSVSKARSGLKQITLANVQSGKKTKLGGDSKQVFCADGNLCLYSRSWSWWSSLQAAHLRIASVCSPSSLFRPWSFHLRLPISIAELGLFKLPYASQGRSMLEVDENRKVSRT